MLMHSKPGLDWKGSTERLGVGKPTHGEVLWGAEWAAPVATATTIESQTSK
jgi:hypothetical protein